MSMQTEFRLVPSSFDPNDPALTGVQIPLSWRWGLCEKVFREHHVQGVLSRIPLFWQLEIPLHAACRAAETYLYLNDAKNMPLGAAALRLDTVDAVVTSIEDANLFAAFLAEKNIALPPTWIVVRPLDDTRPLSEVLKKVPNVYEEIHSHPGNPVKTNAPTFHA